MTYHSKIRQELLNQISRMQPGERIPNELHLAEFFGVSRMTVNKVISELAREGFLVRGRGRGSFVARKKTSRKIVSILLPSATLIPQDLQYIISGATEAARKMGVGIELITVSPDNNKDHIDFSALDHLTEDSYVFVVSNWFHRVFPFLWQKKCKTLLLDRQLLQFAPQNEFIRFLIATFKAWSALHFSGFMMQAAAELRSAEQNLFWNRSPVTTMNWSWNAKR